MKKGQNKLMVGIKMSDDRCIKVRFKVSYIKLHILKSMCIYNNVEME